MALAHSCFARNLKIVQCAQDIIKGLPTDRFQILLNYLFTDGFGKSGEKFLQLVDELRGSDVMRHLLRLLGSQSDTGEQYYQLARWLRNTGILDKYLRLLLTFPPAVAENAFMLLTRLDYRVPTYLARLTDSLPPQMCLEVLKLLGQLEWQSETPLLRTIRKLIQHENPAIRARTADFVGRTSQNVWFLQRLAQDPVPEVRLSTLRAIMKSSVIPPKIITLLRKTTLSDSDVRVRVKAAQLLYHQGDIEGLRALIVMLDQPTSLERAYAARILGELKEISVRDNLKALVQGDADSTVRSEALKALKALDEQVEFLIQQFKQLEGILTRYRLSGDEQTKRFLWDYLEALDRHPVTGMIQSTDLAPETFRQFMAVVNEVGMHVAIPFLFATIIDEDRRIGNEKTADLYRMRAETTQIVRELQSGEPETIARTFDKLTRIQQDMVKVMLVAALNVENPTTTVAAAKTLHELAYALGIDKLSVLINGSDYAKRVEAVKALSIISDEFAARQLLQLEDEPDGEIRDLVHTGLAAIHSKLERYDVGEVQLMIKEVDPTESPMVKLHALITDAENRRLGDVELNDLVVLEGNDKPLKARHISSRSHTPVAVAMIMDYSGSMTKAAIRDVEMATKHFRDSSAARSRKQVT